MSHKSNKSAKVALGRAVGSENKEKNKHITKITANSSKTDVKADKNPVAGADEKNRPTTAVAAKTAGKAPEKASGAKAAKNTKDAKDAKTTKKSKKSGAEKPLKEVFILARPFVALGRYIRDSWREIRRVRWPNRKATWKMTGAVLAYCAVFMVFIVLLDSFFTWLFSLIIQ